MGEAVQGNNMEGVESNGIARNNVSEAARTVAALTSDLQFLQQYWAREEYIENQRMLTEGLAEIKAELAKVKDKLTQTQGAFPQAEDKLANIDNVLAQMDEELARKNVELAQKDAYIADLQHQLAEFKKSS